MGYIFDYEVQAVSAAGVDTLGAGLPALSHNVSATSMITQGNTGLSGSNYHVEFTSYNDFFGAGDHANGIFTIQAANTGYHGNEGGTPLSARSANNPVKVLFDTTNTDSLKGTTTTVTINNTAFGAETIATVFGAASAAADTFIHPLSTGKIVLKMDDDHFKTTGCSLGIVLQDRTTYLVKLDNSGSVQDVAPSGFELQSDTYRRQLLQGLI